MTKIKSLTKW